STRSRSPAWVCARPAWCWPTARRPPETSGRARRPRRPRAELRPIGAGLNRCNLCVRGTFGWLDTTQQERRTKGFSAPVLACPNVCTPGMRTDDASIEIDSFDVPRRGGAHDGAAADVAAGAGAKRPQHAGRILGGRWHHRAVERQPRAHLLPGELCGAGLDTA